MKNIINTNFDGNIHNINELYKNQQYELHEKIEKSKKEIKYLKNTINSINYIGSNEPKVKIGKNNPLSPATFYGL